MRHIFTIFLLFSSSFLHGSAWVNMTLNDLAGMHKIITENSSAALDKDNSTFVKWLEEGFVQSKAKAKQVSTFGGYVAALRFYAAGFRETHHGLYFAVLPDFWKWPGFTISYMNGDFVVSYVDKDKDFPKVGDHIIDFDGISTKEAVFNRVFPYLDGTDLSSEADLFRATPRVLFDEHNPFLTELRKCTVVSNGEKKDLLLNWEPIAYTQAQKVLGVALFKNVYSFGIDEFMDGRGAWVSVPTFQFDSEEEQRPMKDVIAKIPSLRNREVVVIDVRGNEGGSSTWGNLILEGLYGDAFVNQKHGIASYDDSSDKEQFVEYRVSPNNLKRLKEVTTVMNRAHGQDSIWYTFFDQITVLMERALKNDSKPAFVRSKNEPIVQLLDNTKEQSRFAGKLVFITDENCFSSCLDFADIIFDMPNVMHVGLPTRTDSPYTEVNGHPVPSKMAWLNYTFGLQHNRKRGVNQAYIPKSRFNGDMRDTKALKSWVEHLLSQTLE